MQNNYYMNNLNPPYCIFLQQTTCVYVFKRRSNTLTPMKMRESPATGAFDSKNIMIQSLEMTGFC